MRKNKKNRNLINIKEEIVKLDYDPHEIWIYVGSHIEKESRAFSCRKEPETVEWIESYFKKGDVAFDIGANIGAYSLIMSNSVGNEGMIYAFEPGWHNFFHLNKNIILNKCQDNIMALNIALSSEKKISIFNYQDLIFGSSLHTLNKPVNFVGNKFTPEICQKVLSYTVDEFVEEFGIKAVNHIKLDVDGIESEIIRGAEKTLRNPVCRTVMVELNKAFKSDLESIRFLQECGFQVTKKVPNPSDFYESDTIYNYIFAKK